MKIPLKIRLNYPYFHSSFYGASLIVLVALLANLSNSLIHSLPPGFSSHQILLFKAGIGFLMVTAWVKGDLKSLMKTSYLPWQFVKGLVGFLGNWLFIISLQGLPLAESSALSLTSSLMTTAGAYYFFSEYPARVLLYSLAIGFIGVLMILKPSVAVFQIYSVFPLLSALAFSISSLLVKKISLKDSSLTTLSYLLMFIALFSVGPAVYNWQALNSIILLKLIGISCLYTVSQLCLIEAYTYTQAAFLAPFKFARFPIALLLGYFWFGEHFSLLTLGGGGLIIASYFYLGICTKKLVDT